MGTGCQVDSFLDPSKSGYWEHQPTTMPILAKIDVIERNAPLADQYDTPGPQDLLPNSLETKLGPGDLVRVEVYELVRPREMWSQLLRVDQAGRIRVPEVGDMVVAGMTTSQLEDSIKDRIQSYVLNPTVNVSTEDTRAFQYTIYGLEGSGRQSNGLYNISRPDFRLLDAVAAAGGIPRSTKYIYVIRHAKLDSSLTPSFGDTTPANSTTPTNTNTTAPIDVEDLINQLGGETPSTKPEVDVFPGMLGDDPVIDIDELEPVRVSDQPPSRQEIRDRAGSSSSRQPSTSSTYIYDPQTDRWIRSEGPAPSPQATTGPSQPMKAAWSNAEQPATSTGSSYSNDMYQTRIIEIPYEELANGDPRLNIVIRPGDYIHVSQVESGVVYIEGEVNRPGVYTLPPNDRITLSRLVAAAGGLGSLAIPERVDLIRIVGEDREATITLDLGAIRNRTEPDVYLKPNDHVIIGTNFWALPLAVIRNGFRATYGFGFLLDRNFGNDVFGAPPTNQFGQ